MDKKPTQKERVIEMLTTYGEINNFWAWQNQIWRLGALIHNLRQDGWEIRTEYMNENAGKNCYYYLEKKPRELMTLRERQQADAPPTLF